MTARPDIEPVLAQVLRLLDLTLDLERNQLDARFAQGNGTTHYVFDENVFELFVQPWRMKALTATFYSAFWLQRAQPGDREGWSSIAAQSALITAEYLLSGALPAQHGGPLHMTEWHLWELGSRIDVLVEELRLRNLPQARRSTGWSERSIDREPMLRDDLNSLRASGGWTKDALDRFALTRIAARVMSEDEVFEPIAQLTRLVTTPIRDKIENLSQRFDVTRSDWREVEADTLVWFDRLIRERERQKRPGRRRGHTAFMNDAHTLALVRLVAKRCDRTKEQVVLVTGDALTFDAYRRWYANLSPDRAEFFEPFALRRLVQFAPIFNMNDGLSDISDSRELFRLTREAVELTLLPFNLSRLGVRTERQQFITRAREHLALKLVDAPVLSDDPAIQFFARNLSEDWLRDSRQHLNQLRTLWQRTERAAIGGMYDSVVPRMTTDQRQLAEQIARQGASDVGAPLGRYVQGLLDRIVEESGALWLPLASRFIDDNLRRRIQKSGAARPRPPMFIRLVGVEGRAPLDLSDLMERWLQGDPTVNRLLSGEETADVVARPELVFAIAATFALAVGEWASADRFSELALRACDAKAQSNRILPGDRHELAYLHAVSKRFRIGDVGVATSEAAAIVQERFRDAAKVQLDACLRFHGAPPDGRNQYLQTMRALSERAALNLFFASAIGLAEHSKWTSRDGKAMVTQAFDDAEADLTACLAMDRSAEASIELHDDHIGAGLLKRVRRQVLANAAASTIVRRLIDASERSPAWLDGDMDLRIETLDQERASLPTIVQAEVAAYLVSRGLRSNDDLSIWAEFEAQARADGTLPLDRALMALICGNFGK